MQSKQSKQSKQSMSNATLESATENTDAAESLVEDDALVEEVSIDGMCGVY